MIRRLLLLLPASLIVTFEDAGIGISSPAPPLVAVSAFSLSFSQRPPRQGLAKTRLLLAKDTDDDGQDPSITATDTSATTATTTTAVSAETPVVDGEMCLLPFDEEEELQNMKSFVTSEKYQQQQEQSKRMDRVINLIPVVIPVFAYLAYERVATVVNDVSEMLSSRNFVEVDGGSYRAQIIAPAINGIIIPACVVTFATLLSITISFLRQRQQEIRTNISAEAGELRILQALVDALPPGSAQDQCRTYLIQYTSRLIAESQPNISQSYTDEDTITSGETEMNGFLNQIIHFEQAGGNKDALREDLRSESYSAVARLNSERSARIASLQSSFPPLHYTILTVLAISVCACYLLETDQDVLVFLYALQLKVLWSILVGVFTGFGVVTYDLIDPFQGSYQISSTVNQLYTIRSALVVSINEDRNNRCDDNTRGSDNEKKTEE